MPVVIGAATSHAPSMFAPAEKWPELHRRLVRDVPQPHQVAAETPDVLVQYTKRIDAALDELRRRVLEAKLDALIICGDDQTELFSKAMVPAISIFIGEDLSGSTSITFLGESVEENHVSLPTDPATAKALTQGLMDRGFDPAHLSELVAMGTPGTGLGHAFTRIARALRLSDAKLPVIPLFLNSSHPPFPSGRRMYQLGRAIAEVFAGRPERIGIIASGGLSHNPLGPRAGWVDEPLDEWVLETIKSGNAEPLANLFSFDTDAMRGGAGELRSWIVTAAALEGRPADIIDYIPAYHAVTGLGFAAWPPLEPAG